MSSWLEKRVEEYRGKKADKEYRQSTVNLANYWHTLLKQIETDVAAMNAVADWSEQLNPPIKIEEDFNGVTVIEKAKYPFVRLSIANRAKEIDVEIDRKKSPRTDRTSSTEVYSVIEDGRHIISSPI